MSRGTKDLIRSGSGGAAAAFTAMGPTKVLGGADRASQRGHDAVESGGMKPTPPPDAQIPSRRSSYDTGGIGTSSSITINHSAPPGEVIEQYKKKLDLMKKELDERTDNVNAIQRNFQRLSEMYSGDRQRLTEVEEKLKVALEELNSLRAQKKVFMAIQQEFNALQARYRDLETSSSEREVELTNLVEAQKRELAEAVGEVTMLRQTVEQCGDGQQESAKALEKCGQVLHAAERGTAQFANTVETLVAETSNTSLNLEALQNAVELAHPLAPPPQFQPDSLEDVARRLEKLSKSICQCAQSDFRMRILRSLHARINSEKEQQARRECELQAEILALRSDLHETVQKKTEALQQSSEWERKFKEASKFFADERAHLQKKAASGQASLSSELDDLKKQLVESDTQNRNLAANVLMLEEKLHSCRETIAQLQDAVKKAEQRHAALQTTGDEERHHLSTEISHLKEELERAKTATTHAWEEAAKHRRTAETALRDAASKGKELEELRRVLEEERAQWLKEKTTGASEQEMEVATLRHQLRAATEELRSHLALCGSAQDEHRLVTMQAERKINEMSRTIEQLQHELAIKSGECLQLQRTLDGTTDSLAALKKQVLAAGQADADAVALLEEKNIKLTAELRTMDSKMQGLKSNYDARIFDLEHTIKSLTIDARTAENIAANAKAEELKATAECSRLFRENQELHCKLKDVDNSDSKLAATQRRLALAEAEAAEHKRFAEQARLTEAELLSKRKELDERVMKVSQWATDVRQLQSECIKTVKKVLAAEQACESGYSCGSCLEVMRDPVVVAPCGHAFCRECFAEANGGKDRKSWRDEAFCPECKRNHVTHVCPSRHLELLSGKFSFRCRALRELASMLEKTYAAAQQEI